MIADVRDAETLVQVVREADPDAIFHLAAQPLVRESYRDPVTTVATNVMGTVNLLEAVRARQKPCVVVVVTSDKCYENREWIYGYRETDAMAGHDPYSMSKSAAELVVASWRGSFFPSAALDRNGICLATARAGNVIGGGDWQQDRILAIPGVNRKAAVAIVAETGGDMGKFPTAGHLSSWGGFCPGQNESAGKRRSGRTRRANRYLRETLTECGLAAARAKKTALHARYARVKSNAMLDNPHVLRTPATDESSRPSGSGVGTNRQWGAVLGLTRGLSR